MGLKDFWARLTGGDRRERFEEEMTADRSEQPEPVEDYEGLKDDVAVEKRFGETDFDADEKP